MEATNNHRAALLNELKNAQDDKIAAKELIRSETAMDSLKLQESFEVKEWLADQRIKTIEAALIDNELNNY